MISKSTLQKAKSFLCWEVFSRLTVQLIERQNSISYFFPPSKQSTIIVLYPKETSDFTIPLFHLFHEAGHLIQYNEMNNTGKSKTFWNNVNIPTGKEKMKFEQKGWQKGHVLLKKFMERENLESDILEQYDVYAVKSTETYK
ncbi:MAG: hypothetical protein P8078_04890 [bacterium]